MGDSISAEELIGIVQTSDLDPTIKEILIRDIKNDGANEFLIDQVLAYCDNSIDIMKKRLQVQNQNPAA